MRLPNLIVAGVTKAGTTSIYTYLRQHDQIFCPDQKELNYFSPLIYGQEPAPLAEYAAHYAAASSERWLVDASPFYFTGAARIAPRLMAELDRPRVIISIRDPLRRLWSAYTYQRSQGRSDVTTFTAFLAACMADYDSRADLLVGHHENLTLRTGRYIDYLPTWANVLGPGDLRVVFMETLSAQPHVVMRELFDWLGIPDASAHLDAEARNVTAQPRSMAFKRVIDSANGFARARLHRNSGPYRTARRTYRLLAAANSRDLDEVMLPSDRERVKAFYEQPTRELAGYLSELGYHDMPAWLQDS